jgi:hypothetical protein
MYRIIRITLIDFQPVCQMKTDDPQIVFCELESKLYLKGQYKKPIFTGTALL